MHRRSLPGDSAMNDKPGFCWRCGAALSEDVFVREGECPQCRRQTHVCRNCRFYQPGRANDCLEPVADAVSDKTRANFCDYFEPNPEPVTAASDSGAVDLRAAAEALFKSADD